MSVRDPESLRITEIFFSLQGETRTVGIPTVFIRLTGCPLRCQYCDTAYAFQGGKRHTFQQIFDQISQYKTRYITVTGGEPLAQPQCIALLNALIEQGYIVSLETSGAIDVADVHPQVVKVLDLKTPDSNESERNLWSNLQHLLAHDQVKFVICSRKDYEWSREVLRSHQLENRCEVLFSPSYTDLTATQLAEWILGDQLPVRLQIQLHKYLWGNKPGV
jgi:7-carboxy-7-deazaguanine synthase